MCVVQIELPHLAFHHISQDGDEHLASSRTKFAPQAFKGWIVRHGLGHILVNKNQWPMKEYYTISLCPKIAPASIPSRILSIWITHTPVFWSPFIIVCCIGAAPRYAGSNEGWTLSLWDGWNELSIFAVSIRPNDAVTSMWFAGGWSLAPSGENANGSGSWRSHKIDIK